MGFAEEALEGKVVFEVGGGGVVVVVGIGAGGGFGAFLWDDGVGCEGGGGGGDERRDFVGLN